MICIIVQQIALTFFHITSVCDIGQACGYRAVLLYRWANQYIFSDYRYRQLLLSAWNKDEQRLVVRNRWRRH